MGTLKSVDLDSESDRFSALWIVLSTNVTDATQLIRGGIANRTCGTDKTYQVYIYLIILTIFGPIYYDLP